LLPIKNGIRDELLPDLFKYPLDYGRKDEFPFKIMIQNPNSEMEIPQEMVDCLQTLIPSAHLGAEYLPLDIIHWNK
jgi:hypothetical protein